MESRIRSEDGNTLYPYFQLFLRDKVGKYLADTFTLFTNQTKSQICMICAAIYRAMGFRRKNAFFARLAVLFRLHVDDNEYRSEADYKLVYPVLYSTLAGYGIDDSAKSSATRMGHVSVQVKAIHEVFMSAQRAGFVEASVRHLCYMLQVGYGHQILRICAENPMIIDLVLLKLTEKCASCDSDRELTVRV